MHIKTALVVLALSFSAIATAQTPEGAGCDFSSMRPVRISEFIPKAVAQKILPQYPDAAFKKRLQGRVSVRILVRLDGTVAKVCATRRGPLTAAAEHAAKQWIFKPNFGFDKPRYSEYAEATLVFVFRIRKGRGEVGVEL